LSTVATSTLTPALNVLSTTLPVRTCFSLVRTNAPPLPGLTCWNSTTDHSSPPSSLSTMPFLRSFVVATSHLLVPPRGPRMSEDQQLLGGAGEQFRLVAPRNESVLDPDATYAGEIDSRLHGDRNSIL